MMVYLNVLFYSVAYLLIAIAVFMIGLGVSSWVLYKVLKKVRRMV